jgi:hypothetical protein
MTLRIVEAVSPTALADDTILFPSGKGLVANTYVLVSRTGKRPHLFRCVGLTNEGGAAQVSPAAFSELGGISGHTIKDGEFSKVDRFGRLKHDRDLQWALGAGIVTLAATIVDAIVAFGLDTGEKVDRWLSLVLLLLVTVSAGVAFVRNLKRP